MEHVKELTRHDAPGGRPQPLAFHDGSLWVGCWDTPKLYAIDPATWTVRESADLPGKPYGIAPVDGSLYLTVSMNEEDDRHIVRYVPGQGLQSGSIPCPEMTGSYFTGHGGTLYLVQMGLLQLLEMATDGSIRKTRKLPTRLAGIVFVNDTLHAITADADFDVLELAKLDISGDEVTVEPIAAMSDASRGLAFDGKSWWTNYREENQTIAFSPA